MDEVTSGSEVEGLKLLDQDEDGEVSRREFVVAVVSQGQRAETMVAGRRKERYGNEDGRLTGTESSGPKHFGQESDERISKERVDKK